MTTDIVTTDDRWSHMANSRFATPDEWLAAVQDHVRPHLHLWGVVDAFAAAADDEGLLLDYSPNRMYEQHVSDALREEEDEPTWRLEYDRFAAQVMLGATSTLLLDGFLAHRGNGDSVDYRLAVPHPVG